MLKPEDCFPPDANADRHQQQVIDPCFYVSSSKQDAAESTYSGEACTCIHQHDICNLFWCTQSLEWDVVDDSGDTVCGRQKTGTADHCRAHIVDRNVVRCQS